MQTDPLVFKVLKALQKSLEPHKHYLLAVSGGSDSIALADACARLANQGYANFTVCHVEHGLRGEEALHDMDFVEAFCKKQNLPCFAEHVDVLSLVEQQHLSIEDAARKLRYLVLYKLKDLQRCDGIITAHNQDDQAETILLRLLRGSGTRGLGGMREKTGVIIRPLLNFSHRQLKEYCQKVGLSYCHDSSNDDLNFTRNRIRHELLPYLEHNFNSDIKSALVRLAFLQQEDADYLEQRAKCSMQQLLTKKTLGKEEIICLDNVKLRQEDTAIRRRVLRTAYFLLGQQELDYERTLALDNLCLHGGGNKIIQLPGKIRAVYKNKQIILKKFLI